MHKTKNWLSRDGELYLIENFYNASKAEQLFQKLYKNIHWRQEEVRVFGRVHPQPRLVAWHGDPGLSYHYSGLKLTAKAWTETLVEIKEDIEATCQSHFNSVLLNLYRNERDSNGWHSDDEKELGPNPFIASLSLGESRDFHLRHKRTKDKLKIKLQSGSLLVMAGKTQSHWQHSLPKRQRSHGPRINLTFRKIIHQ